MVSEAEHGDPGRGGALHARRGPGVQVAGVDHPGDERPDLLRVPAPVPAPGRLGPDRARDDARTSRSGTRRRAAGRSAAPGRRAAGSRAPERVREAALAAVVAGRASGTAPPARSRAGRCRTRRRPPMTWIDEPVRVERRHQRADRRVEHQPGDAEQQHHGQRDEQPERAQRRARAASTHQPGRRRRRACTREHELVHVAPRHPLGGEAAGDQRAAVQRRRPSDGEPRPRPGPSAPGPAGRPAGRGRRPATRPAARRPRPAPAGADRRRDAARAGGDPGRPRRGCRTRTRRRSTTIATRYAEDRDHSAAGRTARHQVPSRHHGIWSRAAIASPSTSLDERLNSSANPG